MFYSQKDPNWGSKKLGGCVDTISQSGCLLVSCCNLFPRIIDFKMTPPEFNDYCKKNGLFDSGCLLNLSKVAAKLGMSYEKTTTKPKDDCIAETNHYAKAGVPQHFYMLKPDNSIIDPLDKNPDFKVNPYNVVSYRVFKKIKEVKRPDTFGVDVSHWQGKIDWTKVNEKFAICKCTQGTSYVDETYETNKKGIRDKKMVFGAYHFADGGDVKKEVAHFLKNIGEIYESDLIVLDWEIEHKDPVGWCNAFLSAVEKQTGLKPYWYTNDARGVKYGSQIKYPKWIARYADYTGELYWDYAPKSTWDIWQYTSRATVDGIKGNVDRNVSKIKFKLIEPVVVEPTPVEVPKDEFETYIPEPHTPCSPPTDTVSSLICKVVDSILKFLRLKK